MKTKAFLASLVLVLGGVGLITYKLNQPGSSEMLEGKEAALPKTEAPLQPKEVPAGEGGELQKLKPAAAVDKSRKLEPTAAIETASARSGMRIHGVVTDKNGKYLSGASLRWIPLSQLDLRSFRHDRSVLGKEAVLDKVPEGKVREALGRSQLAESGERGDYELLIVSPEDRSVVVASMEGYELVMRSVKNPVTDSAEASGETKPADAPPDKGTRGHDVTSGDTIPITRGADRVMSPNKRTRKNRKENTCPTTAPTTR